MADGAGDIDDDFLWSGVFLLAHRGEGAEEEAADVGEDGGAAWGDAALLKSKREVREVGVDVGGGFLFGEILTEEGEEVGGVALLRQRRGGFGGLSPFLRQGKAGVVALKSGAFGVRAGVESAEGGTVRG